MTADEIRKITIGCSPKRADIFEDVAIEFCAGMLQEIAAQLAELNFRLSGQGQTLGSRAQVDAVLCASNDTIPVRRVE